jgi:hypothetical protein
MAPGHIQETVDKSRNLDVATAHRDPTYNVAVSFSRKSRD